VADSDDDFGLTAYTKTALSLLHAGYYSGLLAAVAACFKRPGTFLIVDCASGSGKTQAGVALRQLDHSILPETLSAANIPKCFRRTRVVHLIWPGALAQGENGQSVYHHITTDQQKWGIDATSFFDHVMKCDFDDILLANVDTAATLIWNKFLKYLFSPSAQLEPDWEKSHPTCMEYSSGKSKMLIFIDEVPEDAKGVHILGLMRDSLRHLSTYFF
jgi:hypothetical protein